MGKFEDVVAGLDLSGALDATAEEGPVDMTALLTRRFAWDTTQCALVPKLLESLGLPLGAAEGMDQDHRESHQRMSAVLPLEGSVQAYGHVLGAVLTQVLFITQDVDTCAEHEDALVRQNTELLTAGIRAVLAQLMFAGVIAYGPAAGMMAIQIIEHEEGPDDQ